MNTNTIAVPTNEAEQQAENLDAFRQLVDNLQVVLFMIDPECTRTFYASRSYETVWGRSRDGLYTDARDWMKPIVPEDKTRVEQSLAGGPTGLPLDFRITRGDGAIRSIRSRSFPIVDRSGRLTRVCGVAEDITEERERAAGERHGREALDIFNQSSVERELKMIELKRKINELSRELERPAVYDLSALEEAAR